MRGKSFLNRKVQLAFASAMLALIVVGLISYRGMIVSSESVRWVRHTHDVLENLQGLTISLQTIESSYRGFVLTGEESSIDSYRSAIISAQQEEANVRNLTADNPQQQRHIPTLEMLVFQKIQFDEQVIDLRRAKGMDAAADVIRNGQGQPVMGQLQDLIGQMRSEEMRLLELRDADAKRRMAQTKAILIFGTVLGMLVASVAGWLV